MLVALSPDESPSAGTCFSVHFQTISLTLDSMGVYTTHYRYGRTRDHTEKTTTINSVSRDTSA